METEIEEIEKERKIDMRRHMGDGGTKDRQTIGRR